MRILIVILLISSSIALAYNFDNAQHELVPTVGKMQSFINIMNFYGKVQRDKRAIEFFDFFGDCMDDFDFDELYESSYLTQNTNGYRSLTFHGHNEPEHFSYELPPPEFDQNITLNSGDLIQKFSLKKNDATILGRYRSFSFYLKSKTAWGKFSLMNFVSFLEALAKVVDPSNLKKLKAPESPNFTNLTGESRQIWNGFYKSFPNFTGKIGKYHTTESILKIKNYNNIPYTHLKAEFPFNIEVIEKDFPELSEYMEDLNGNFKLTLSCKTITGNTIVKFIINSTESITQEVCTRSGKVIPFDSQGNPVFSEEFKMTSLKDYKFIMEMEMRVYRFGIKFAMNMIYDVKYHIDNSKSFISCKIKDIKRSLSGNLLWIIPPAVIDVLMPGNIDQLMNDYSQVLINANEGEGTIVLFEWDTRKPGNIISYFNVSSELLDNFFIRFAMKMSISRFRGNKESREQLEAYLKNFIMSFITDLKNEKNKLAIKL